MQLAERNAHAWHPRLYEGWLSLNPFERALRRREHLAILGAVQAVARGSDEVLELGPGTGTYTLPVAATCRRLVAVDSCSAMRSALAARLAADGIGNVELREGLVPHRIDLEQRFDGVLAAGLLEYLPSLSLGLAAIARLLKPGGWAVFTVAVRSPGGFVYLVSELVLAGHFVRLDKADSVIATARRHGLASEQTTRVGVLPGGAMLVIRARRAGATALA